MLTWPQEYLIIIKKIVFFILTQATLILLFIPAFFLKRRKAPKYFIFSLTGEQAIINKSTDKLFEFLNEERFGFDACKENCLIEVRRYKYIFFGKKMSVTYDAAIHVLLRCMDRNRLLKIYTRILKRTWTQNTNSMSLFEWKKLILDSQIWQEFLGGALTDIFLITTQSSEFRLPPAFKSEKNTRVNKIMFWYGTNTEPLGSPLNSAKVHSNKFELNHFIDKHYVWDEFQSQLLEKKGITNREVKGSIVFIPRDTKPTRLNFPTVVYFDVTPHFITNSAYTEEFCISTLLEVISACDEISKKIGKNINLLVKPKRNYTKIHSKKYLNLMKELHSSKLIEIAHPAVNIYDLISGADITLGIIYTSPVLIAKELRKPSFFLGLNKTWIPNDYNDVKVLGNSAQLKENIFSILNFKS